MQIKTKSKVMLGNYFIWDLPELREIVIPDGVEKVEDYQLYNGNVKSVTISASVREICPNAFCDCRKLMNVVFKGVRTANALLMNNSEESPAAVSSQLENS